MRYGLGLSQGLKKVKGRSPVFGDRPFLCSVVLLFQQDHFAGLSEVLGGKAVEVNAAGHRVSVGIASVPGQAVVASALELMGDQSLHLLAQYIVDCYVSLPFLRFWPI